MKHLAEKIKRIMTAFDRSHYDYMIFKEYGIPDFPNYHKKNVMLMKRKNKKEKNH